MASRLLFFAHDIVQLSIVSSPLRILHLEDEPDFTDLVRSLLQKEGLEARISTARNKREFEEALAGEPFDLILADYHLPDFDGLRALRYCRRDFPDLPFLIVSGTMGEEAAIESLRVGVTDYVLKLWPERLVPAIRRAVREAEERKERKRIETELIRREKYFRTLTENALDIVTVLNGSGVFLYNSPSIKRVLGCEPGELAGKPASDLVEPGDLVEVRREFERALKEPDRPISFKFRARHKDGSWRCIEAVGQNRLADAEIAAIVINSRDITERKRLEDIDAALSRLGQSLSSATTPETAARIIRSIADDLFRWDAFTLDLYSAERDLVFPIVNVDTDRKGERFEIKVTGEGKAPSRMARRIISHGAELILREEPLVMPADVTPIGDTSRPSASLLIVPIRNRTKVIGILSIQSYTLKAYNRQDLNTLQVLADHCGGALERIHAEQALRQSELLFHSVWENSVDGMRLTDELGNIVAVNQSFCKLVGMSRQELEGQPVTVILAASEDSARMLQHYRESFRDRINSKNRERKLTLRSGSVVTLEDTSSFVELNGRPPLLLALFRDVTAQRRLEEQLRQSQKMEAIGQLAGGVAHDFNNILTVIHGHASLLMAGGTLTGTGARSAVQIGQAAERAASLTRQLLTFSRRQVMQPRCLDMNDVVSNMTKMLSRILGEDVALRIHYAAGPALVQADAGMMEQVLLNLAVNSRDAMPKGGQLSIRIDLVEVDTRHTIQHHEAHTGRFVCVTTEDTGCGIAPENLRRIFEPFFTTKEMGKGTGLGLATVYGIVKQHQGWLEVESEVGKGTTFKVYLPCSLETHRDHPEKPPERPVRGGTETILVVEDEAPVRELVCSLLAEQGYQILQAESGVKALEVWADCKDRIDLVLTDLVMPDRLNGRELAERLWADRPKLKVIFTSGYSADVVGKDFVLRRGLNYLQKPYQPQKLALTVRDCLDAVN